MILRLRILAVYIILLLASPATMAAQTGDADRLGMALEYFTSAKYQEALIIFQDLEKKYKLNYRFKAYEGLCYYYLWDYEHACKYLDGALPHLDALDPRERSVYCYANGESHFMLAQYDKAIPYYKRVLTLGYDRDKGDAYYRLGFCHMFKERWSEALVNFNQAREYYTKFRNTDDLYARLSQIDKMTNGCKEKIVKKPGFLLLPIGLF